MLKKCDKWFADWRDERGRRHRRAFTSKAQAARYTTKQRAAVAGKKARASQPSGKSARRGKKPKSTVVTRASRSQNSAASQGTSQPAS